MTKKYRPIFLSRDQLENILSQVGVRIVTETAKDLICYCPFHHNVDTPALNFEKTSPYRWRCQNAKCGKTGNIFSLITKKGYTVNEARHMLFSNITSLDDFEKLMQELLSNDDEEENVWEGFDPFKFVNEDIAHGERAKQYALSRGITEFSYKFFLMGYSSAKDMLVIPVHGADGAMLGVIGRSIEGKQYRYSAGLQRGKTIFNIRNADAFASMDDHSEIILTEGALDSIYISQAGFNNVGTVLGSAISEDQWKLLKIGRA